MNTLIPVFNHNLECCVCFENELMTIYDAFDDKYLSYLDDFDTNNIDNYIFLNPCLQHSTCVKCLRKMALDFDNHQVNNSHSLMRCMAIFGCENDFGMPFYFPHESIIKLLTHNQAREYEEYVDEYRIPGFKQVYCVNCHQKTLISKIDIQINDFDKMFISCFNCLTTFCYYCHRKADLFSFQCEHCKQYSEFTNPCLYNHYFQNPEPVSKKDILYKNCELNFDSVVEQIFDTINNCGFIKCAYCKVVIEKIEQCNCIEHCGIEICYACGKVGEKENDYKLNDHWSELGVNGCPRYDDSPCFMSKNTEFKCDKYCQNIETGHCTIPEHQEGIRKLKRFRIEQMIFHKLKTIPQGLRDKVIDHLENCGLSEYLPENPKSVFKYLDDYPKFINYYDKDIWNVTNCFFKGEEYSTINLDYDGIRFIENDEDNNV